MLVRDAGDAWQVVLQTDHADLSGQLLAAWGGTGFARPQPLDSVVLGAMRHDDGWAVWDRRPRLDPELESAPQNFVRVGVQPHLAFYRAGVEVTCDEDLYAGMLVSMHMSGLYRARYGVVPAGRARLSEEDRALADVFCDQEEERQASIAAQLEVPEQERWTNYALLQIADLVSLFCGLADLETGHAGVTGHADDAPTADGGRTRIELQALGPWRLRFSPYPFVESPQPLTMVRRILPKRPWRGDADFRADFEAATAETVRIYAQA